MCSVPRSTQHLTSHWVPWAHILGDNGAQWGYGDGMWGGVLAPHGACALCTQTSYPHPGCCSPSFSKGWDDHYQFAQRRV